MVIDHQRLAIHSRRRGGVAEVKYSLGLGNKGTGGAGVAAFYTATAAGTLLAEGKETRVIDGKEYVLELGIKADFCIMRGHKADTLGNVVYKGTSRNFNPVMATAARVTIVEVDEIVELGSLDPEEIVTPGIFIDRIVKRPDDFSPYL